MKTLNVKLPGRVYKIDIGLNILNSLLPEFILRNSTDRVVVVTNTTVHDLYPDRINQVLQNSGVQVSTCVLPDGEQYKNLKYLSKIFDYLMKFNANRKTLMVAFGGGVIGDMAGFAAATFMRGIPFIQVPTTLLADVDSSVGGKTAVNHPSGKNIIGSFKQPEYVCIELSFLKTLPSRELKAGFIELLKHGLIKDVNLFEFLKEKTLEPLDFEFLEDAIFRSCEIKGRVVEQDETETGLRAILNFGHTLGHLIETHAGYGTYLHGEAVGAGMCFAAFVSWRYKKLSEKDWEQICGYFRKILTPVVLYSLEKEVFSKMILHDKKAQKKEVNFIMLKKLGESFIQQEMQVEKLWGELNKFTELYSEFVELR